jgi:hypothetical protein
MISASRHVFGTTAGYGTLAATPDVSTEERRELESYSFGQTADRHYLSSLAESPAWWSRSLPSGRRAITRALPGAPDDKGRSTLLLSSVLVDAAVWAREICGVESTLMRANELWAWNGEVEPAPLALETPGRRHRKPIASERRNALSLLGLIEEVSEDDSATVIIEPQDAEHAPLELVAELMPYPARPSMSMALRSLSDGLPVLVNVPAAAASRGKSRRRLHRWRPGMEAGGRQYTQALRQFWREGADVPDLFIRNAAAFGRLPVTPSLMASVAESHNEDTLPTAETVSGGRRLGRPSLSAILIAAGVLVIGATTVLVAVELRGKRQAAAVLSDASMFLQQHMIGTITEDVCMSDDLLRQAATLSGRVRQEPGRHLGRTGQDVVEGLRNWTERVEDRCAMFAEIRDALHRRESWLAEHAPPVEKLNQLPSQAVRRGVLAVQGEATGAVGAPGLSAETRALADELAEQADAWLERVAALKAERDAICGELKKTITDTPPPVLSDAVISRWSKAEALWSRLTAVVSNTEPEHGWTTECREAATRYAAWNQRVPNLRRQFESAWRRVKAEYEKHQMWNLPSVEDDLGEGWGAAKRALADLAAVDAVWPAYPEAADIGAKADAWRKTAELIVQEQATVLETDALDKLRSLDAPGDVLRPLPTIAELAGRIQAFLDARGLILQAVDANQEQRLRGKLAELELRRKKK